MQSLPLFHRIAGQELRYLLAALTHGIEIGSTAGRRPFGKDIARPRLRRCCPSAIHIGTQLGHHLPARDGVATINEHRLHHAFHPTVHPHHGRWFDQAIGGPRSIKACRGHRSRLRHDLCALRHRRSRARHRCWLALLVRFAAAKGIGSRADGGEACNTKPECLLPIHVPAPHGRLMQPVALREQDRRSYPLTLHGEKSAQAGSYFQAGSDFDVGYV
ncbi:MAG: hypothetical protein B7X78_10870 [Sphingomonadales bacterium 39-62-4]|nr:MAG: hypothetical protein B7X78_10870 [Sphingomonadales bacterium 39-62-4]